ncbi:MAG: type III pantothenate kinase, partial [Chloroflexota bacterium]
MLLVITVGNTSIKWGIFDGDKLRISWRWATDIHRRADEYAALLFSLFHYNGLEMSDIKDVVISSVVPPINLNMVTLAEQYFHSNPLVIEAGVRTGVRIRIDNPREVGADRIVNAAAIRHLYGGPAIVVDMGTATTFDVVPKEGDYLG